MRVLAILGDGAERDAGRRLRLERAAGATVLGARLPTLGDAALPPDAREFVTQHGALWPNPAYWLEWGSDLALGPTLPRAGADLLVIACPDPSARPNADECHVACPPPTDPFGRPAATQPRPGRPLRIGLLGGMHLPHANPAPLATLGDAAERLGLPVLAEFLARDVLPNDLAGLILPGGGNLNAISAQIAAAATALDRNLPVLGLCLGMQSMTTTLARLAGWPDAMLEERAGPGRQRSFTRLRDELGRGWHRVGEVVVTPAPNSLLGQIWPDGARVRVNHRFALEPDVPVLPGTIIHRDSAGIADAIEVPGHRFFVGLQGHPELGRAAALDRLWDAFLIAADSHAN